MAIRADEDWTWEIYKLAGNLGGKGIPDEDYFTDEGGPGPLILLNGFREIAAEVEKDMRVYVSRARKLGHSWDEIGQALGISRQAAHKRFARP